MMVQVGVKVVLKNPEGNILLLLRSDKYESAQNTWDIPGGRIDADSTLMDNLAREVHEETGLQITSNPRLVAAQDIFFKNTAGEEKHIVRLTYCATTEGIPSLDGEEHTEYRLVAFDELSTIPNLDPYLKKLVLDKEITKDSWK